MFMGRGNTRSDRTCERVASHSRHCDLDRRNGEGGHACDTMDSENRLDEHAFGLSVP